MFQIETPAKAKLEDIEVLSQKNRKPDEGVGVKLTISVQLINGVLSYFSGQLKSFLFEKGNARDQAQIPGTEVTDMQKLSTIGQKIKTLRWNEEITGLEMTIDRGLGGDSNIVLDDAKADNIRISPKEGGTVLLKFNFEAGNVPPSIFGDLAMLKSRDIDITLTQHEPVQDDVEQRPTRGANGAPPKAAAAPVTPAASKAKRTTATSPEPERGVAWPFPEGHKPGSPEAALLASQAKGPTQ